MEKYFLGTIENPNQTQKSQNLTKNSGRTKAKISRNKALTSNESTQTTRQQMTASKKVANLSGQPKSNKSVTLTKVKSGSWKRSDKSISPLFNPLSNKSHKKTFRKKSPNWLKFSNSKIKLQDQSQADNGTETTSTCRPGTLYSDVLFGAGCSNLVKINNNNSTNRQCTNTTTAQKKLTKALFKFSGNRETETSEESEIEDKLNLFPALEKVGNKAASSGPTNDSLTDAHGTVSRDSSSSPSKAEDYSQADVVVLSDLNDTQSSQNHQTYGNYLEQQFEHLSAKDETPPGPSSPQENKNNSFLISSISNIPKWNFTDIEADAEVFPKFLCQFDDEHYLKAERLALMGLKLALGNQSTFTK